MEGLELNPKFDSVKKAKAYQKILEAYQKKINEPIENLINKRFSAKYEVPKSMKMINLVIRGILSKPFSVSFTEDEFKQYEKLSEEANKKRDELKPYVDAYNKAVKEIQKK